jgi:kinesin family protein 5
MMGSDIDDPATKGMTPRLVERVFEKIMEAPSALEFTVCVSFLEIYMEKIRDLLDPINDNLPVHEDKSRGVYVKGLKEVYVRYCQCGVGDDAHVRAALFGKFSST